MTVLYIVNIILIFCYILGYGYGSA